MPTPFERAPGPAEPLAIYQDGAEAALMGLLEKYGTTFRIFEPSARRWILVTGAPEVAERVLVANARGYQKGFFLGVVELLLGNSLMVSEGAFWLQQRRKVQRMFHEHALRRLQDQARVHNDQALSEWQKLHGQRVDLTMLTSRLVLRTTLTALFGDNIDVTPFLVLADVSARDMRFRSAFQALDAVIAQHIAARISNPGDDAVSDLVREDSPDTVQLLTEVKTLIVAGHETTASAMAWMWLLLAQHPEVNAPPASIVNETLRLYPPGWMLSRRALAGDVLADIAIDAGTEVLVSPYLLGRNPHVWSRAAEFIPARFGDSLSRSAFIPFGAGPRRCPGDAWALCQLQIHLETMSPSIQFEPPLAPVLAEARVNLRSKAGIHMVLRDRSRST